MDGKRVVEGSVLLKNTLRAQLLSAHDPNLRSRHVCGRILYAALPNLALCAHINTDSEDDRRDCQGLATPREQQNAARSRM